MKYITTRHRIGVWLIGLMSGILLLATPQSASAAVSSPSVTSVAAATTQQCVQTQIRYGSRGSCVVLLQRMLIDRGYSVGPSGADGSFGYNTKVAVVKFQTATKLVANGVVGPLTWNKLLATSARPTFPAAASTCSKLNLSSGSRGSCVVKLQQLLAQRGEWIGPSGADGSFGRNTKRGVVHYQKLSGLVADGVAGPKTWGHLLSGKLKMSHLSATCFSGATRICTDKSDQKTYVFKSGVLKRVMPSRTGGWHYFKGQWMHHNTPTGRFSILNRVIDEKSGLYDGSPMPYSQYITTRGHAYHGSPSFTTDGNYINVKGVAGSGGCVNLIISDAKWLWGNATYGALANIQE